MHIFIKLGKPKCAIIFDISNSFVSFSGYLYIISGSIAGNLEHSSCLQYAVSPSVSSIILKSFFGIDDKANALQNELVFVSEFNFVSSKITSFNSSLFLLLLYIVLHLVVLVELSPSFSLFSIDLLILSSLIGELLDFFLVLLLRIFLFFSGFFVLKGLSSFFELLIFLIK